jgi:hypothetical protein
MGDDQDNQEPTRDWQAFWASVDANLVPLPPGHSIKADIEDGRL